LSDLRKLPSTGYPEKLRPSAAQISALFARSNRTVCSCTSRTSDVLRPVAGSVNSASSTGTGVGVGVGVGCVGVDWEGVGVDGEPEQAGIAPINITTMLAFVRTAARCW
jgi:hypothetical protein